MTRDELTEQIRRIWFDDMPETERVAAKQAIGQALGLPHAQVVGCINFDEEAETPADVADNLLRLAGGGGGACST